MFQKTPSWVLKHTWSAGRWDAWVSEEPQRQYGQPEHMAFLWRGAAGTRTVAPWRGQAQVGRGAAARIFKRAQLRSWTRPYTLLKAQTDTCSLRIVVMPSGHRPSLFLAFPPCTGCLPHPGQHARPLCTEPRFWALLRPRPATASGVLLPARGRASSGAAAGAGGSAGGGSPAPAHRSCP